MKNRYGSFVSLLSLVLCTLFVFTACADRTAPESVTDDTTEQALEFDSLEAPDNTDTAEVRKDTTAPEETDPPETTPPETDPPETEPPVVHVDGLTLDKYEVTLAVGESDMPWVTMTPADATDKSELWSSNDTAVATVNGFGNITGVAAGDCTVTVRSVDNTEVFADVEVHVTAPEPAPAPAPAPDPAPDTSASGIYEPAPAVSGVPGLTYINGILIANKTYALPSDYDPGIDATAYAALTDMFAGAAAEGISLWVASGYRSYETQNWLYNNYVSVDGKEAADTYSARPGHSEHQTGLAFDLNYVADYFANTPEGIWLANNCWRWGFIIRYPAGKEGITGYKYEPWHVRYLGTDVSKAVFDSGLCLEEYLGITSVYAY